MHTFLQAQAPKIAGQVIVGRSHSPALRKAANDDAELAEIEAVLARLDFAGWASLVGDVEPLLSEIAAEGSYAAFAQIGFDTATAADAVNVVNAEAVDYAESRSAEMVGMRVDALGNLVENPRAEWRIDESTRDYLRAVVGEAITEGQSNAELAQAIEGAYAFSGARARMIARTETSLAANAGALSAYKASGVVDGKIWLTADDDLVSEECAENGDAGPIALDAAFPSGDDAPPVHPNCRCAISPYIIESLTADDADTEQ